MKILVFLLFFFAISFAGKIPKVLFDFPELLRPNITNGRSAHQNFHHKFENGKTVTLKYDVTHHHRHVSMDNHPEVIEVDCKKISEGIVILEFSSPKAAQAAISANEVTEDAVLSLGSTTWQCKHDDKPILARKVVRVVAVHGKKVYLQTVQAGLTDIFQHAKIEFSTSAFPNMQTIHHHPVVDGSIVVGSSGKVARDVQSGGKRVGDIFSWFSKAWAAVKSLANDVTTIINGISLTIKTLTTGTFNGSDSWGISEFSYNYDASSNQAQSPITIVDNILTCSNCYLKWDVTLNMQVDIENYQLNTLQVTLDGNAVMNVQNDVTVSDQWSNQDEITITTINVPTFTIAIGGVPVSISIVIPINVGYSFQLDMAGSFSISGSASGSLSYGIAYNPSTTSFSPISKMNYALNGAINNFQSQFTFTNQLYLFPTLFMEIDYIGGPYVSLKPFLETTASLNTSLCSFLCFGSSWGLQLSIGAKIDIANVIQKDFGPWTVVNTKKSLLNGCLSISYEDNGTKIEGQNYAPVLKNYVPTSPNNLLPGAVWEYSWSDLNCDVPAGFMSQQFVGFDENQNLYFVNVASLNTLDDYCIVQGLFIASLNPDGSWNFGVVSDQNGNDVEYVECANNSPFEVKQFSGTFDNTFSSLTVPLSPSCGLITLS